MEGDRRFFTAAKFCMSVRDGTHDSPKPVDKGRYLVTSRHITGGQLDLSKAYLISEQDYAAVNKRSKVDRWDVLISMIGTVGEPYLVHEEPNFAIKNIGLFKSKGKFEGKWLFYYLRTPYAKQLIKEQSRGTTQQYIPLGSLREFPILVPEDKSEMQAIACILGVLDDKIELNRRMNRTLETTARAIFKSWFVDFEPVRAKTDGGVPSGFAPRIADLFPDSFEDSELGKIPKGWEIGSILKIADLLSGGTPKTSIEEYWNGDIPWASAKDVSQCGEVYLIQTERKISEFGLKNSSTKIIPSFSSVVVARGATTGRMAMFGSDIAMNQTCYALTSKDEIPFFLYCYFRYFVNDLVFSAHGSVFDTITTRTFETTDMIIPAEKVRKSFDKLAKPLFLKILGNQNESRQLSDLRDTLLPKLISGDLRVPDAGRIVARYV